jgi:hypothetical protein
VIDQRGKNIHQQDGQHDPFGEGRIQYPDEDGQYSNEQSVYPFAPLCLSGTDRVCCHEYGTEGKTSQHKVLPERYLHQGISPEGIQDDSHQRATGKDGQDDFPVSHSGVDQEEGPDQNGQRGSLSYRTGDHSEEHVHTRHRISCSV